MLLNHAHLTTAVVGLALIAGIFSVPTRTKASVNSNSLTIDFTENTINSNSVIIEDTNVKNSLALIQKFSSYIHTSNEGPYSIDPEMKNRLSVKDIGEAERFLAFINTFPSITRQQHIIKADSSINANEMVGLRYIGAIITPDRCVLLGYWGQFLGEWNTWKCYQVILQSNEDGNAYGLIADRKI
ncbi:hypothetical protein [Nostoc sp. LPT]|uniref:hypothetical protein n=1 Tax=Nostoc sp. LPT TaxID=2815387 RepID=UPI001D8D4B81|nr:hypothetical protein [Nostoc sp. LPT]MBN4001215.1 hypothetical protein [Nostoc sp. LPT]